MIDGKEKESGETGDDALIREIREEYSYMRDYWRENFEESKTDLKFVSGDPWPAEDRMAREDNGRPVLSPDELEQYLNATINNLRQNPMGIKVEPKGEGATDKFAEQRQAIIRNIEYDSIAQAAYTNAFSCAINCGFGYFRVTTKKVKKGSNEVEPRIKIIGNPLSVMMDPNAKEADYSDQKRCFVFDVMRRTDFVRAYPKATKQSFTTEDMQAAPDWFVDGQNIVLAEYWRIDGYDEDGDGGKVTQYITNGLEILNKTDWPGSRIPIIPVLGKETYVPMGGKMSRMFFSMIRKARGPQMMLAYLSSQEAEEYGMAPRAPFVGYVGQFDTDKASWETLNKIPRAYVQVDPMIDQGAGSPLPLPTRPSFIPNAQAYEIGKESWRRAIQSAMGISPLPTAAQRQNEKSGVALERIQTQQSVGAYHFTANFKLSLQNAGEQINELITKILDTPREIAGRGDDGEQSLIQAQPGSKGSTGGPEGHAEWFDPEAGEYDVTISSGPSYQSQREQASDFADTLVEQVDKLPVAPQAKTKLLALAVKLKDIGPLGDEMADILDPQQDQPLPPQAQAQMAQLTQQLQVAHQMGSQLYQKVQELEFDKKARVTESQSKIQQIAVQHSADMELEDKKLETQLAVAEVNTKAQNVEQRLSFVEDLAKQFHSQAHDLGMQAVAAQQQQALAQQQAQASSQQSTQDAAEQSAQNGQDAAQAAQVQAPSADPAQG